MYAVDRQAAPATQHVAADPPAEPVGIHKTYTYIYRHIYIYIYMFALTMQSLEKWTG